MMRIAVFSTQAHDEKYLTEYLNGSHELIFYREHLTPQTVRLAENCSVVCCFVNDDLSSSVLTSLQQLGVRLITLRSAGFNHVDLAKAHQLGMQVASVPAYSPHAIAEHAVGLILALNRKIHRAYNRIRENDFSLHGLMGFDCHLKTVGIIGYGKIGQVFATIMQGFGCRVLVADPFHKPDTATGLEWVSLDVLYEQADIISLHCPLSPATHHLINTDSVAKMKQGVMLINTSRGALINTRAVIDGLKQGRIGYLGLDVYEEEGDLFFENLSDTVIQDDLFCRLLTFPNVIITGHQAFFTEEAVRNIAEVTCRNILSFAEQGHCAYPVPFDEKLS